MGMNEKDEIFLKYANFFRAGKFMKLNLAMLT